MIMYLMQILSFICNFQSIGPEMGVEEAVVMLQRHERARQGRLRAKLMLEIRRQENAEKNKGRMKIISLLIRNPDLYIAEQPLSFS